MDDYAHVYIPRRKEHAFHLPLVAERAGWPWILTLPSLVKTLSSSIGWLAIASLYIQVQLQLVCVYLCMKEGYMNDY